MPRTTRSAAPIEFTSPEGKEYALTTARWPYHRGPAAGLAPRRASPAGRRRARWPARCVDFGLYFFHNAAELIARGSGPYFYLPKMESHLEARLWNDVFTVAQEKLGHPARHGPRHGADRDDHAAFEMDEILYELRDHASGLNAGRWDYLFSMIKNFRDAGDAFVLPDRAAVDDDRPVHAGLQRAAGGHVPPPRRLRDGRHGRLHPEPARPGGQRAALAKVRAGQGARGDRRLRRLLGGAPGPGRRSAPRCSTPSLGDRAEPARPAAPGRPRSAPRELLDVAARRGRVTEAGVRANISVVAALPRRLAARQRRGRASTT